MSDVFDSSEFKEAVWSALNIPPGPGEVSIRCPKTENHKHGDKNPSAALNRTTGRWFCHTCGAKGNAWHLAVEHNLDPKTMITTGAAEIWEYSSQSGTPLQVHKYPGKKFRQKTFKNEKWVWKGLPKGDLAYPLYIESLELSKVTYLVEGEKDVDSLRKAGCQATTNAGGSKALHKTDWSVLQGHKIVVIPDCDQPGYQFVDIFNQITDFDFRVLDLNPYADKKGYDISDFLAQNGVMAELKSCTHHEFLAKYQPFTETVSLTSQVGGSALYQLAWNDLNDVYEHKNARTLLKIFDQLGIKIRYEVRACKQQIKFAENWQVIDDFNTSALRELIRDNCMVFNARMVPVKLDFGHAKGYWKECFNALLYEESRRVDSFLVWLQNELPEWDKIERLDHLVADLFETNHTELTAWAGRYLFIGPIQRAFDPGSKLDEIPVFYGDQGTGKSTFIREILPEKHRLEWHGEGMNFASDEKRFIESLLGRVIVEAGEMVGANRAENSLMKALITRQVDSIRLTYAENVTDIPRRCIIVGSTDSTDALPNDPAGNRRFVIIELNKGANVEKFLDEKCNETDSTRMQLWAEAMHMFHAEHIRANLPRELYELRNQMNALFRNVGDSLETTVLETAEQFSSLKFTLAELKDRFPIGFTCSDRVIGSALLNNGYKKKQNSVNGRRIWQYERT